MFYSDNLEIGIDNYEVFFLIGFTSFFFLKIIIILYIIYFYYYCEGF